MVRRAALHRGRFVFVLALVRREIGGVQQEVL